MTTFEEGASYVADGIRNRFARFVVTKPPNLQHAASLVVGSWRCNRVMAGKQQGFVISMGLSRDQLAMPRDQCQELIDAAPADPSPAVGIPK